MAVKRRFCDFKRRDGRGGNDCVHTKLQTDVEVRAAV